MPSSSPMIKKEIALAEQVVAVLRALITNEVVVTHVFGRNVKAQHDHVAWLLRAKLSNGYHFTFWVEGRNLATVCDVSDAKGIEIVGGRYPINVMGMLSVDEQNAVESIFMGVHDQVYATLE